VDANAGKIFTLPGITSHHMDVERNNGARSHARLRHLFGRQGQDSTGTGTFDQSTAGRRPVDAGCLLGLTSN